MILFRIFFLLSLLSLSSLNFHPKTKLPASTIKPSNALLETPAQLAQEKYFGNVIDVLPNTIVGNFGEPRSSHFHTGLDYRTNQQQGYAVFAAADGYISRINVSSVGYGNALYITHPNGYVTVYGHLKKFQSQIMARLRKEQYAQKSFAVDFSLPPNEIKVKKGETIALSGNTGSSGGPHLHFEIRDAKERVYNALLFGYKLKDDVKPIVSSLKFYPMDKLKFTCDGYRVNLIGKQGVYETANSIIKLNAKQVGFSVNTYDMMNLSSAHIAIYNITVFDNDKMTYQYQADRISFPETRYVLSLTDYPIFENEWHKTFYKCFVEPGNKCPMYLNILNKGIIDLSDEKPHNIHIEVSDFAGNVSVIKFQLQNNIASTLFKEKELKYTTRFDFDHDNEFSDADIKIKIPKGCLFDTVFLNYSSEPTSNANIFSKIYQLGNSNTEVFNWFNLSVKAENLNPSLNDKAIVVYKDDKGSISSRGGKFENGFIATRARDFGTYYVMVDTTAPKIKMVNLTAGKNMRSHKKIYIKITDNLSGISRFDTYIDNKWTETDYDAKTDMLIHTLDKNLSSGQHTFKIVVTDERDNRAEESDKFVM